MDIKKILLERSQSKCELCSSNKNLTTYDLPPVTDPHQDRSIMVCSKCHEQIEKNDEIDVNHWRCLNESMWSEVSAVQVMAWRMLKRLSSEGWAQDLLEQLYLEEEILKWAEAGMEKEGGINTKDSNGSILSNGDSVTLIKDLDVKGAGFTAKRGTIVRKISLTDNPEHIEGRVNGVQIVLLTKYLKKSN